MGNSLILSKDGEHLDDVVEAIYKWGKRDVALALIDMIARAHPAADTLDDIKKIALAIYYTDVER